MTQLTDEQWTKIYSILGTCGGVYVKDEAKTRRFVEAILWIVRTGAQWRALPEKHGRWNSVAKRFGRGCQRGIWENLLAQLASEPDLEWLLLDSTIIRAHPCAAGAPAQPDSAPTDPALGRSRGGFSTKIHIVVDALATPSTLCSPLGRNRMSNKRPHSCKDAAVTTSSPTKPTMRMPYWI